VLEVNVVRDQIGNRVNNVRRRVIRAVGQHSATGDDVGASSAFDMDKTDAKSVIQVALDNWCWRATALVVAWRRSLKGPIHRHNTPIVGPELTPEFCIESCFTYTIVLCHKTFREK
jgi:hypothetical protein